MYQLKGFVTNEDLLSNAPNVVAAVGELSQYAYTFAKDVKHYPLATNRKLMLEVFSSKEDGEVIAAADVIVEEALAIADWMYARQGGLTSEVTKTAFLTALTAEWQEECTNLNCGSIVKHSNNRWYPQWISWKSRSYSGSDDNANTIWFSDASFRTIYDEYDYAFVPPLSDLAVFFQPFSVVKAALEATSAASAVIAAQQAIGTTPTTVITPVEFEYVDPLNGTNRLNTTWIILIWGPAGNDYDRIKNALAQWVVTTSGRTQEQWMAVLPDLFRVTEFYLIPTWNKYAIPNRVVEAGVHSAIVRAKDATTLANTVATGYGSVHVSNYTEIFFNPYKSLQILAIGSPENRDALYRLSQIYGDMIGVNTQSLDFNRMSAKTQAFLTLLSYALPVAEEMTLSSIVPASMRRAVRSNRLYVSFTHERIQFLLAAKETLPA